MPMFESPGNFHEESGKFKPKKPPEGSGGQFESRNKLFVG